MSEFEYTDAQRKAISSRGQSVLVSAGAGSGKTAVLVERLIDYIKNDEQANINDFVIITYTKAAASELRSRISERLSKEACAMPTSSHLRRQVALCTQAKIGTIHSFCAQLLRQYSKEAGISPDFKIVSDEKRENLRSACLEKYLGNYYAEMDTHEGFELLVNTVGVGNDDRSLFNLILSLHSDMLSHPEPEKWAASVVDDLEADVSDAGMTIWGKEILEDAADKVRYWNSRYLEFIAPLSQDKKLARAYLPSFSDTQSSLEKLEKALSSSWDETVRAVADVTFPRLSSSSGTDNPELADEAKACKEHCSKVVSTLKEAFSLDSERLLREMKACVPAMKSLLELTLGFDAQFRSEKKRLRFLDYSDLEHITYETLLADSALKSSLSMRYREIMVDEYQDVNAIQDAIFTAISDNGKKLFMVGDIKQSIYRFRLADPTIFIRKCEQSHPIALTDNFRSREEIIDCVNLIFEKCMSKQLGDVEYDEDARLKYGAKGYEGSVPPPELLIYERTGDDEKYSFESYRVGCEILEIIKKGYNFGDIAVLLRSPSAAASTYCEEFAKLGIPVETSQGNSFFSRPEVCGIVNLLRAIDNPRNDTALLSALRTFSFTADDLSRIRSCDRYHNLYSALSACDDEKCVSFLETLEKLRKCARDMTSDQLLMSLGCPVTSNLLQMVDIAVTFENDGYHGIHRFVRYLDRLAQSGNELSEINLKSNAVHIMSIHKSKGLEFPVVFLCDTMHKFNFSDLKDSVLVHPELGLGPKYVDAERLIQYPTLARNAIALRLSKETRSEELRLLYVALTRARERLIITASVDKDELNPPPLPADANTFLDWLRATGIKQTFVPRETPADIDREVNTVTAVYEELPEVNYIYKDAVGIPASVTSSELKKYSLEENVSLSLAPAQYRYFRKPDFTKKKSGATAPERGSAMHRALQHIDFSRPVCDEIERLRKERFISDSDAEIIDISVIEAFLSSPLGIRIKSAEVLRREFRFLLLVNASDLLDTTIDEKILLNGVVDCCFEEDGEIVIVDYKTDREDRSEEYAPQIKSYALALERVFNKKVREAYLYYLNLGYEKRITV